MLVAAARVCVPVGLNTNPVRPSAIKKNTGTEIGEKQQQPIGVLVPTHNEGRRVVRSARLPISTGALKTSCGKRSADFTSLVWEAVRFWSVCRGSLLKIPPALHFVALKYVLSSSALMRGTLRRFANERP